MSRVSDTGWDGRVLGPPVCAFWDENVSCRTFGPCSWGPEDRDGGSSSFLLEDTFSLIRHPLHPPPSPYTRTDLCGGVIGLDRDW